jgi:hypothetical protein
MGLCFFFLFGKSLNSWHFDQLAYVRVTGFRGMRGERIEGPAEIGKRQGFMVVYDFYCTHRHRCQRHCVRVLSLGETCQLGVV